MSSKQEIKSEFLPFLVRRNDDEKYEIFSADEAEREVSHLIRKFNWKIPAQSTVAEARWTFDLLQF